MVWKDRKDFTADMKHIYNAPNKQSAEAALNDFAQKWESNMLTQSSLGVRIGTN